MKNVYVILPQSETGIAKIARFITKYPYSHVTISLDDNLEVFYSFSRIFHDTPFISGYVKEYRSHLASKKNVKLNCKIFKIPVCDAEYESIVAFMKEIEADDTLLFNYLSMATLPIFGGFEVANTYNCGAFVARAINRIHRITLHKKDYKFFPKDFEILLENEYLYFEGALDTDFEYEDDYYFHKISWKDKVFKSGYLMKETCYRFLFKRVSKNFNRSKGMILR